MYHIIAADWGTSHLRVYLCQVAADGQFTLLESKFAPGVRKSSKTCEQELIDCIADWAPTYGKTPVYLAGQVGSSIGWKETQYLPCPIAPQNIAQACLTFDCQGYPILIVPGLSCRIRDEQSNEQSNEQFDVMRGEELQVLGWLQLDPSHRVGQHLLCLPGTHTKWVLVNAGEIQLFKTAMTGELYDLLSKQSVLIQQQTKQFDEGAFETGARFTLESEADNFSHGIFSVRSKQLFGQLTPLQASSYLSGLLIGSDVRAAIHAKQWNLGEFKQVVIIGEQGLSQCFSKVLALQNINSRFFDEQTTSLSGFSAVYQIMGSDVITKSPQNKVKAS
jgi:2-dehydro-3-deoxygalactonokinase